MSTSLVVVWNGDRRGPYAGLLCLDPVRRDPAPPGASTSGTLVTAPAPPARPGCEPAKAADRDAAGATSRFSEAELRDACDLLTAVLSGHGQTLRARFMAKLTGLPEAIVLDALDQLVRREDVVRERLVQGGAITTGYRAVGGEARPR